MAEITPDEIKEYLSIIEGQDITLPKLRTEFNIMPGTKSFDKIRDIVRRLVEQKILRPVGRRGEYRVIKPVEPINWWNDEISEEPINLLFPRSHEDETEFGIEDCVEVFPGDMIAIAGASNFGKTTLALNILGENLGLMPCVLMGSEYTASDGKISPKFKRRMNRMKWVTWIEDSKPRFKLYPVGSDYEDYVQPDSLNVIDWVSLPGEYYLIDTVMKAIKDKVGRGIAVVVLQKNRAIEWGEGGERTERYADIYITLDPYGKESMITLGKVKAPKGKATGRMWAFDIVDFGANLHRIREIVKCSKCWGKGYIRSGQNSIRCDNCQGKKFVDK